MGIFLTVILLRMTVNAWTHIRVDAIFLISNLTRAERLLIGGLNGCIGVEQLPFCCCTGPSGNYVQLAALLGVERPDYIDREIRQHITRESPPR